MRTIAAKAERWVTEMDFGFLLHQRRKLLSVGYHLKNRTLDSACYDLLASEARIAAFIAIGKGDVPQETWSRLGRAHVPTRGGPPTLISWAGTMFEYLMPAIWMRSPNDTMLRQSMQGAVRAQKEYAAEKHIPWGISEAGFGELDDAGVYGYEAIGVPELALRDQEQERLVVAPYACAMALAVAPADALDNLRRMAELGWLRDYGFYEAADFGASSKIRAARSRPGEIVDGASSGDDPAFHWKLSLRQYCAAMVPRRCPGAGNRAAPSRASRWSACQAELSTLVYLHGRTQTSKRPRRTCLSELNGSMRKWMFSGIQR